MRIVSGTGRSGTSMWMQILNAAGCTVIGEAFPMDWGVRLSAANPAGFFETTLRSGINFTTNPDPHSGAHIQPETSGDWVTKVMSTGLRRTDRAFIDKVVISVRRWPDFIASIQRLFELDRGADSAQSSLTAEQYAAWWFYEHHAVLQDAGERGYPIRLVSYEETLRAPDRVVPDVLEWLGVNGNAQDARAVVNTDLWHQQASPVPELDLPKDWISAFDALVERVAEGRVMEQSWLNQMHDICTAMAHSGISDGVNDDALWQIVDKKTPEG